MKNFGNKKGFTLIELLVVIAVVGVISGVIMQSLMYARQKSRDTTRKTELNELQKAITHYFTTTGSYPSTSGAYWSSEFGDTCGGPCVYNANYIPNIVTTNMISSLPKDPLGGINMDGCATPSYRAFIYRSDGIHYKLLSNCALEIPGSYPNPGSQFYDPVRPTWALQVTDSYSATATW